MELKEYIVSIGYLNKEGRFKDNRIKYNHNVFYIDYRDRLYFNIGFYNKNFIDKEYILYYVVKTFKKLGKEGDKISKLYLTPFNNNKTSINVTITKKGDFKNDTHFTL